MRSEQVIQAIQATLRQPPLASYDREVVETASGGLDIVYAVLRQAVPCETCGGRGVDEAKPYDPTAPGFLGGQTCDACNGRGFAVEDGDAAVFAWVAAHDRDRLRWAYPAPMDGRDVRTLRAHLGISQRELADRINAVDPSMRVSATTVSRWETGQRAPSPHSAAAMRKVEGMAQRNG